jgi:hypothetical protein
VTDACENLVREARAGIVLATGRVLVTFCGHILRSRSVKGNEHPADITKRTEDP